jgi:hypothetical protein
MKIRKLLALMMLLGSFAFLLQVSTLAKAQDDAGADADDQGQDPPGRVARLNYSQGSISFRPAGEDDWVTGVPNRPLVTGDDLWADEDSRAEVHVGSAAIRLGAKTGITFLTLDDNNAQIRLAQGSLIVRVRHVDDDDTYEIDTPNIAFTLLQPGEYRVDVSEDGSQTIATVWHGRGHVTGGGFTYNVIAGQSATFTGSDHLDYDLEQLPQQDDFDDWAFDRDSNEDQADSANYVSREMTGYEDLDQNGTWSYVAGYGEVWAPIGVAVGWAPYRFGHWAWVGPWGWTWVEDEPWGFAPFHYGRWAFANGGWFWVPGPVVVRPVYAPALVAFVGGGPGFGFAVGAGVGWFPLAPGEVFVPGYRVSRAYVNNVNITNTTVNVTQVTNVYNTVVVNRTTVNNITYANQHVNNAVTVVSHDAFVNARPVSQNIMKVDAREIATAPVSHVVAAEPVRASVVGVGRPVSVKPPAAVISRPVVAVRTPPPPPQPITQRQAQAGGHLNQQALVRPAGPTRPANQPMGNPNQAAGNQAGRPQPNQPQQSQPNQNGFRSFAQPGGQPNGQPGAANTNAGTQVKPMLKPQPRVYEQQGSAPENAQEPNRGAQQFGTPREEQSPAAQSHPLVKPAPPVQERSPQQEQQQAQKFNQWQQQRPATPPAPKPQSHPAPPPKSSPPPKSH